MASSMVVQQLDPQEALEWRIAMSLENDDARIAGALQVSEERVVATASREWGPGTEEC